MENFIGNIIEGQGLWATTSILLCYWVLSNTEKREKRFIEREDRLIKIIEDFKEHFVRLDSKTDTIIVDVDEIKDEIKTKRGDTNG